MALPVIPPDPEKTYAAAAAAVPQRQKRVLFRQNVDNITTTPIWRRGQAINSAFFDLSINNIKPTVSYPTGMTLIYYDTRIQHTVFKTVARTIIPPGKSFGLGTHQEGSKVLAEIFFDSPETMTHHCNNGIPVDGHHVYGFPSLAPQVSVLRIKLSSLPFIPEDLLSQGIFDLLAPYGIVLEGGIMMDHGWFDANGYAIIQIPLEGESSPAALTHELSWQDECVDW
ncbi:hypothetical protein [Absidia glauca]|uniref:Uncharacterized protein n=1 Tax=Absidia glauca TaxID=4829 RepID=A0A168LJD6_ABSGL|nr:hypothetical protein [Absidia glauca]